MYNNDGRLVPISSFVDQSKYELIGYQAFYKDGTNKFYEKYNDIPTGTYSTPLIDVKQVGRAWKATRLAKTGPRPMLPAVYWLVIWLGCCFALMAMFYMNIQHGKRVDEIFKEYYKQISVINGR